MRPHGACAPGHGRRPQHEVADIFQTYVYRTGLLQGQFGFATAVGLFNSVIALALVLIANWGAKRLGTEGLF